MVAPPARGGDSPLVFIGIGREELCGYADGTTLKKSRGSRLLTLSDPGIPSQRRPAFLLSKRGGMYGCSDEAELLKPAER
jgi:hypothetical protein